MLSAHSSCRMSCLWNRSRKLERRTTYTCEHPANPAQCNLMQTGIRRREALGSVRTSLCRLATAVKDRGPPFPMDCCVALVRAVSIFITSLSRPLSRLLRPRRNVGNTPGLPVSDSVHTHTHQLAKNTTSASNQENTPQTPAMLHPNDCNNSKFKAATHRPQSPRCPRQRYCSDRTRGCPPAYREISALAAYLAQSPHCHRQESAHQAAAAL